MRESFGRCFLLGRRVVIFLRLGLANRGVVIGVRGFCVHGKGVRLGCGAIERYGARCATSF